MNSIRLGSIDSSQISSLLFARASKSIAMDLCVMLSKWFLRLCAKSPVARKLGLLLYGMGISHTHLGAQKIISQTLTEGLKKIEPS